MLFGSASVLLVVPSVLWYIGVFGGNFREVDPGRFYRSAQLSGANLENVLDEAKIRSVINLRGPLGDDPAYRSELAICEARGIGHVDVTFSASRLPSPQELSRLIKDLESMPQPILVHCYGGADRSGLVSTLYLNIFKGIPLDEAEGRELTWRFGHMKWFNARAMDDFFDLYRRTSQRMDLRTWINAVYPEEYERRRHLRD